MTCPDKGLSFGSGLGINFGPDFLTPAVGEGTAINAAGSSAVRGNSDHRADINHQDDGGPSLSPPTTPTPEVRGALNLLHLQHGVQAVPSLSMPGSPVLRLSPAILDKVCGGLTPRPFDGLNNSSLGGLSLNSSQIVVSADDDSDGDGQCGSRLVAIPKHVFGALWCAYIRSLAFCPKSIMLPKRLVVGFVEVSKTVYPMEGGTYFDRRAFEKQCTFLRSSPEKGGV